MKRKFIILSLAVIFIMMFFIPEINAQCPMCRMSAESNLEHGGTMGKGLNKGILYILSLPYLLVLSLGIIWYRNKKKADQNDLDIEEMV